MLGIVDVSGPGQTYNPATLALVGSAVRLAEASVGRHERRLDALRAVAAPCCAGAGPGLVVDDHGWLAAVPGIPPVDRVASPTAAAR